MNEGIIALRTWTRMSGRTNRWVADQLEVTPQYLSALRRDRQPSVALSKRIERLTGGIVTVRMLRPPPPDEDGDHPQIVHADVSSVN